MCQLSIYFCPEGTGTEKTAMCYKWMWKIKLCLKLSPVIKLKLTSFGLLQLTKVYKLFCQYSYKIKICVHGVNNGCVWFFIRYKN